MTRPVQALHAGRSLWANVSETARPPEISVEGKQGIHDEHCIGTGPEAGGRRGGSDGATATVRREYKRDILRKADACTKPGDIGALLRTGCRECPAARTRQADRGAIQRRGRPRPRGHREGVGSGFLLEQATL